MDVAARGTPGIGKKPVRSDPGGQGNRCWAPVGGEVAEQDRLRIDHYRTAENRKVAFGTEPVDQILSVDFNDSGPLRALFYGLQELQESAPALCRRIKITGAARAARRSGLKLPTRFTSIKHLARARVWPPETSGSLVKAIRLALPLKTVDAGKLAIRMKTVGRRPHTLRDPSFDPTYPEARAAGSEFRSGASFRSISPRFTSRWPTRSGRNRITSY